MYNDLIDKKNLYFVKMVIWTYVYLLINLRMLHMRHTVDFLVKMVTVTTIICLLGISKYIKSL